jgi:hypothetical protein
MVRDIHLAKCARSRLAPLERPIPIALSAGWSDWRSFGVYANVALRNLPYDPLRMTTTATATTMVLR